MAAYPTLQLDLPNTHLLIETVLRYLPMLMNMRPALTNHHEVHHQMKKKFIQQVKVLDGSSPENFAMKESIERLAFRHGLEGALWGDDLKLHVGFRVLELRDHPILKDLLLTNRNSIKVA